MLKSVNPFNNKQIAEVQTISSEEVTQKIDLANNAFKSWRKTTFSKRKELMMNLALILRNKRENIANLISLEMGMPISQSLGEIEKTTQLTEYYAENAEEFLKDKETKIGAKESFVRYEALGTLLHVAPWNFPVYLALRPIIPAIMAGNTVLLKHSSNMPQISQILESLFLEAGFERGIMQNLLIKSDKVEAIIRNPKIKMATLIGSERAGQAIAKTSGEEIKKTVMELGGSDAFIVLKDADLDKVFEGASPARLRNCGQSCNAAKRFIIAEEIADKFLERFEADFEAQIYGNPLDRKTEIGPLSTQKAADEIKDLVEESIKMGAKVLTGGHGEESKESKNWKEFRKNHKDGAFYPATILTNITKYMPVWKKEVFGPVAPVMIVQSVEEAIQVANESDYGLGASIWTEDIKLAKSLVSELETGNVFVNSMVRSNIKMPYGGIKKSGYGREMGPEGIMEFVNLKSVVFK